MSKKPMRGLPSGFSIEVDAGALEPAPEASDLGDYLDENIAPTKPVSSAEKQAPKVKLAEPVRTPKARPISLREAAKVGEGLPLAGTAEPPKAASAPESQPKSKTRRPLRGDSSRRTLRIEVTLDGGTLEMLDELTADVQTNTPEKKATASEVVRAMIQAVHEARRYARYEHVNRRGQYGSATARAFITDLKEAFIAAAGKLFKERYSKGG